MRLQDSRRLTGPNLHLAVPGAIVEVTFDEGEDRDAAISRWRTHATRALIALGWPVQLATRVHAHGADLVCAAPIDALYLATLVQDWAVAAAIGEARDLEDELPAWRAEHARDHEPARAAVMAAAAARDLPVLLDDDGLSIGHGRRSSTWPKDQVPATVDWSALGRIPVALITGTNGKTTTARMLARIARAAGLVPGNTSTDGLSIDEHVIEEGDWTGPGAARIVLRHPGVDVAVLEVARGGILRRGLAVDRCGAAVVTNISADHLGEYGVDDLATMARVKAVVGSVVDPHGRVVLGADSQPLVDLVASGHRFPAPIAWFAQAADHPQVLAHRAAGGEAWFVSPDGHLTRARGPHEDHLVAIAELPSCFGGAAEQNVLNALAAAALASALGLPDAAIVGGLRSFADNPGRAALFHVGGAQVFLDFAHNPAGIRSIRRLLASLRGDHRLLVGIGVAGDRRDEDIRDVARAVHELAPDLVLVRDLEHYLRGRAPGEVPALLRRTLLELGAPADSVDAARDEVDVLTRGLAWAHPGDLVAILVHVDREQVQSELQRLGAR